MPYKQKEKEERSKNIVKNLTSRQRSGRPGSLPIQTVRATAPVRDVRNTMYKDFLDSAHRLRMVEGELARGPMPIPGRREHLMARQAEYKEKAEFQYQFVHEPESYFWDDEYERLRRQQHHPPNPDV